jgi:hypothetical protein
VKSLLCGTSLLFALTFSCQADLLVDFSPDTTGAPIVSDSYGNQIGTQIVAMYGRARLKGIYQLFE